MNETRAIGIARQSKGDEASFSVAAQVAKLREYAEREGLELVDVLEEQDVSGGTPLAKRDGLRSAVEAIEAGRASVLVVAYFTRLARSLEVQREVVERVEAVGGTVVALDTGAVTHANAGAKLTGTFLGAVAEHVRDVAREYADEAQATVIREGRWCGGRNIPYGYRLGGDGRLEVDPVTAPKVLAAFRLAPTGDGAAVAITVPPREVPSRGPGLLDGRRRVLPLLGRLGL
jgi:site-specific DNA recombinase